MFQLCIFVLLIRACIALKKRKNAVKFAFFCTLATYECSRKNRANPCRCQNLKELDNFSHEWKVPLFWKIYPIFLEYLNMQTYSKASEHAHWQLMSALEKLEQIHAAVKNFNELDNFSHEWKNPINFFPIFCSFLSELLCSRDGNTTANKKDRNVHWQLVSGLEKTRAHRCSCQFFP